ncbi:GAF domain-containing sensor histidine kinase [Pedobacter changchengzhani]|uniref:histidine kinase n=1 Tax=Pedobacter changchengzhani TaxID=2529274 RepID=A0A4R5MLP5_9SPHI|nr:GAF domain-containing sensor histidine kinase [Pedobacter changchengzhani]TDG36640.1 GAF domain-containing sensor histidine kinase [Pedobacter changchengzhani]
MTIPLTALNETERLIALDSYNIIGSEEEQNFDELTMLAAEICQTDVALVTILGQEKQWFKSKYGTEETESPRELAFCTHAMIAGDEVMVVNDARIDTRFCDNPLVTGESKVIFYAGVPLINPEGYSLGTICVINHEAKTLTDRQIKALQILAKQVQHQLELRRKVIELEKSNETLSEVNSFVEKFAKRVAHDIKNPLSSIIMSADSLQKKLVKEGDERSVRLVNIALRSAKNLITYIDDMLDYSKAPSILLASRDTFELSDLLKRLMPMLNIPAKFKFESPENCTLKCSRIALEQILLNLLSNAIRYNDKSSPKIELGFKQDPDQYYFTVADNGIGIAKKNIDKIFQEGFTLSDQDCLGNKSNGVGLDSVRSLIKRLHGKIHVESEIGLGTKISFSIAK